MISLANFSIGNMILKWSNTSINSAVDQTKGLSKSGWSLICTRQTFLFLESQITWKLSPLLLFIWPMHRIEKNLIAMVKNRIASNRKVKKNRCSAITVAYYFWRKKMTVSCYNPLRYVKWNTRTLISQRNSDWPIGNDLAFNSRKSAGCWQ